MSLQTANAPKPRADTKPEPETKPTAVDALPSYMGQRADKVVVKLAIDHNINFSRWYKYGPNRTDIPVSPGSGMYVADQINAESPSFWVVSESNVSKIKRSYGSSGYTIDQARTEIINENKAVVYPKVGSNHLDVESAVLDRSGTTLVAGSEVNEGSEIALVPPDRVSKVIMAVISAILGLSIAHLVGLI